MGHRSMETQFYYIFVLNLNLFRFRMKEFGMITEKKSEVGHFSQRVIFRTQNVYPFVTLPK